MTEDKEKNNLQNDLDLEQVFNSKSTDAADKKKLMKKQKDRKPLPYFIAIGAVVLLLGGGAFTYGYWSDAFSHNSSQTKKDKDTNNTTTKAKDVPKDEPTKDDFYQDDKSPVELEAWQKAPYEDQVESNKDKLREEVITWVDGTTLGNVTNILPSEKDGYTSDVSKATDENGVPNLKYAYQTKENLEYNLGTALNKILNPVFGAWASMPIGSPESVKGAFPGYSFIPMFTSEWTAANVKKDDFSKMPVFADWAGDSYGGLSFNEKDHSIGTWYGTLKSITSYSEPMEDNSGVKIVTDSKVEFTATLADGKKVTKTGQLHLVLVPNHDNLEDEMYRNLISEATLTMN